MNPVCAGHLRLSGSQNRFFRIEFPDKSGDLPAVSTPAALAGIVAALLLAFRSSRTGGFRPWPALHDDLTLLLTGFWGPTWHFD